MLPHPRHNSEPIEEQRFVKGLGGGGGGEERGGTHEPGGHSGVSSGLGRTAPAVPAVPAAAAAAARMTAGEVTVVGARGREGRGGSLEEEEA